MAAPSLAPPSLLDSLSKLKSLIRDLPKSCPPALQDGEITYNFSNFDVPEGETPYFAIDRAWNRTFQGKENVPIGGKYGVGVVYKFFKHFSTQPLGHDFELLELRVSQFIQLVENAALVASGAQHQSSEQPPIASDASRSRARKNLPTTNPSSNPRPSSDDDTRLPSAGGQKAQELSSESEQNRGGSAEDFQPSNDHLGSESDWEEQTDIEEEIVEIKKSNFKLTSMCYSAPAKPLKKKSTVSKKASPRKPAPTPSSSKRAKWSPARKSLITPRAKLASATTTKASLTKPTSSRNQPPAKVKQTKQVAPPCKNNKQSTHEPQRTTKQNTTNKPLSGSSGPDTEEEVEVSTGGRRSIKADWAFEQFHPSRGTSKNGKPIWVWRCRWCPVIRTSPHTLHVREYDKETLPRPKSSNFISHLKPEYCQIPEEALFENIGKEGPTTSGPVAPVAGYVAQRKMIHDFTARGIIAPARKFTKEGFRTAFVKGVIEDGLPFTFGEGQGMKKLFGYSLPEVSLPKRMSVRRDLDVLHTALQAELQARLKSHLLDLIHLDEDHGGATTGKLIFNSLNKSGIAEKMTADNATTNGVTNRAISKRRSKAFQIMVDPKVTGLGCAGHVLHLSAQDLLASFGIVEPSSIVDYYHDTNRQYGLHYSAETDPDILAQEAELETEAERSKGGGKEAAATAEAEYEYEESDEYESDGEGEESRSTGASGILNPLEKAIDAYITQMTEGKRGKKLNEARKRQAKLAMSFHEWESVSQLCKVLEVYQDATLDLSRSDLPTLPMVLPIYKQVESALEKGIEATRETAQSGTVSITEEAYQAALTKLTKYIAATCESTLHLVATALHPAMRLTWFEDKSYWPSGTMVARVRVLLTTMYSEYAELLEKEAFAPATSSASRQLSLVSQAPRTSGLLANAVTASKSRHAHEAELDSYLRGTLP
ncbi:hypothetical protein FRC00_007587, partial [Tulasnella sp. 408]